MRSRVIKPEFWLDDELAKLPRDGRLLFIGLWNMADKDGRLQDNPVRIKASLFPYEQDADLDIEALLTGLHAFGFITRYSVAGLELIQIDAFPKHQNVHPKEKGNDFPSPESSSAVVLPKQAAELHGKKLRLRNKPSKEKDTRIRIEVEKEQEVEQEKARAPDSIAKPEELQALWNELKAPELPAWREMPADRRKSAAARLEDRPLEGANGWRDVIARLNKSRWARGLDPDWKGVYRKADIEFFLRPSTATKILEGKYDDRKDKKRSLGAEDFPNGSHLNPEKEMFEGL